jgi:hypothetical protein
LIRRVTSVGLCAFLGLAAAATAFSATARVRLPSASDVIKKQLAAEQLLRGGRGPERTLPGRADDRESVDVAIDTNGQIADVKVVQRLRLHGLGDYFFKIPGPVRDVEALPSSSAKPGLRKGSTLWQGFSDGSELLAARLTLVPEQERSRLPLEVSISATIDGEPITGREPVSGHLKLGMTIGNVTGSPTTAEGAAVSEAVAAHALDAVHAELLRRSRPEPGTGDIPVALRANSAVRNEVVHPVAPLDVTVSIELPPGSQAIASNRAITGRRIHARDLLSRSDLASHIAVKADVHDMTLPQVVVRAVPAPPPAREAAPSNSGAFDRLVTVLADVAQLYFIDGYVGNPDRAGPSRTDYHWTLVPLRADRPVVGPGLNQRTAASPLAVIVTIVLALLVLTAAVVAWSLL